MVRFAYTTAPENVMECLAVQTFVEEIRDEETQRALRVRPKTLTTAKRNVSRIPVTVFWWSTAKKT